MEGEGFKLDAVAVFRRFPGLRVLSAIRLAFDLRKVLVAALGLFLLEGGWAVLDWILPECGRCHSGALLDITERRLQPASVLLDRKSAWIPDRALLEPFRILVAPLLAVCEPGGEWTRSCTGSSDCSGYSRSGGSAVE